MLIDPSGHEYGYIRDFANNLCMLEAEYKAAINYDFFSTGVHITFSYSKYGEKYSFMGTFYFDGTALYFNGGMASRIKVSDNINGGLWLERTDFYKIMGISYIQQGLAYTVTNTGNFLVSASAGAATGLITSALNPGVGVLAGFGTGYIVDKNIQRPGEYKGTKITALLPEYSLYAEGQYRLLETAEIFWKPDAGGFDYSLEPVVYYTYLFPALYIFTNK